MAAEIIFITATILLAWTYLLYPAMVITLARIKNKRRTAYEEITGPTALPSITVVMSVFNEEKIIEKKIKSLLASDYPPERVEFLIGSDGSPDDTDTIITKLASGERQIRFISNPDRRGKPAMINDLVSRATGEILVITDANVIFTTETLKRLAEGFADPSTGLCDATVSPVSPDDSGISQQEDLYSLFELTLKRAEGDLWGAMPGPYGGCYAVRRRLFPHLPENILVDDLFAGLSVLGKGYRSFNIPGAVVYEDTQSDMIEQFHRRIRIAAGSFQNLFRFGPLPARRMSVIFAFLSHKIMRWLTPLLLLLFFMTTVILSAHSCFYFCLTAVQLIFIILSALDVLLYREGKKIRFQRYITHFLLMNAALAAGFVKAVRGVEKGIWEPTKRI